MKPKFKKMVDDGDLESVRISLASEIMLDPRGVSFQEMQTYAENAFPNLYEQHDGASLDQNTENWTKDLLFQTRNGLDENFSKERLDYYFKVAKVVLKDKADKLNRESSKSTAPSGTHNPKPKREKDSVLNEKTLSMCLTVGGFLVGGTGLIIGRTAVVAIGAIGAVIGGYQLYNDRKK